MIGQKLEVDEFQKGSDGVNYLSRFYFSEVWYGAPESTCDIKRILSKLHVTVNLNGITNLGKLQQKLAGLNLSDKHTPIISHLLTAANSCSIDVHLSMSELHPQLQSWWSQYDTNVNWPNRCPYDVSDYVNRMLGDVDVSPLFNYLSGIVASSRPDPTLLLSCPTIIVKEATIIPKSNRICVQDEVFTLPKAVTTVTNPDNICRDYVNRKCNNIKCPKEHLKVCKDYATGKCGRAKCKFAHVTL
jgi:hypothetical protein